MTVRIIDRRLDGKNKSAVNRQRFIRRFKGQIRKSFEESLRDRSVTDIDRKGEGIHIPKKDVSEPVFGHDPRKGVREVIHPGNREFVPGDRMPRPEGGSGGGSGSGQAGNSGEGEDDFVFELSREEFLELFFEDMELPNLVRTQLAKAVEFKSVRAGFASAGSKLNIERTLRKALCRRIGMGFQKFRSRMREAEQELILAQDEEDSAREGELLEEIRILRIKNQACPFVDQSTDSQYVLHTKQPQPTTQAVMFCIMDASGSMDQARKDLAKRFFMILYLFLKRNYEKIEVVFIRHTTSAKEVDEQEFFYGKETGGTIVSSGLQLMDEIAASRYPVSSWNRYVAQASDGDNWGNDSSVCRDLLSLRIMPFVQYFAYIEIKPNRHQSLWDEYEKVGAAHKHFAMRQIDGPADIYPVFRDLFKKRVN